MSADEAAHARAAGDFEAALASALSSWRESRAPEIADAIDALNAVAVASFAAPASRTKESFQADWLRLAETSNAPSATGWLAANLTRRLPLAASHYGILNANYASEKYAALLSRLAELSKRLPDPRIAGVLVEVVSAAPFGVLDARGAKATYGPLLDAIASAGDVRAIEPLRSLAAAPRAKGAAIRQFLADAIPNVLSMLSAIKVVIAIDERARWRALGGQSGAELRMDIAVDGAELLRQIRARPDDDAARLVYADWLQERSDPRGELVVLQEREARGVATEKERARGRALLRAHRDEWLGPLAPVLRGVVFERGFLARAELAQNAAATEETWERASQDEQLSTVVELKQGRGNIEHYRRFVTSPHMRALTSVEVPLPSFLEALLDGNEHPAIQHLTFKRAPKRKLLEQLASSAMLANVRSLQITAKLTELDALFGELERSGMMARLHALLVETYDGAAEVMRRWPQMPSTLERLGTVFAAESGHNLRRQEGRVIASTHGNAVLGAAALIEALPDGIDEIEITAAGERMTAAIRAQTVEAAARRKLPLRFCD